MSAPPDPELVKGTAGELGVDPSFIEKDWHAMRIVGVLTAEDAKIDDGMSLAFSGRTSLSKGHGLIKRFSEDLDFKVIMPSVGGGKAARREHRDQLLKSIDAAEGWKAVDIEKKNQSQFFSCFIDYPATFEPHSALRPQVKLEVSYESPAMATDELALSSFLGQASEEKPEVPLIACVTPVETAADKLSALSWRVLTRERGSEKDDPALVRHLYDLAALESCAGESPDFPGLLSKLLDRETSDRLKRFPKIAAMLPSDRLANALDTLAEDTEYTNEYERFALNMSYATETERPTFEQGLEAAHRLAERIT